MTYRATDQFHANFAKKFTSYSKLFAELGVTLSTPSGDGYVWKITSGKKSFVFLSGSLPINLSSAANLARDKLATCQILSEYGIDTPKGFAYFAEEHEGKPTLVEQRFLVQNLRETLSTHFTADEINSGLILKPGTESGGLGVKLCRGAGEIVSHAESTLVFSHYGLVQEYVPGEEYRVAILDDEILAVYRKHNPVISGDGVSTLRELLNSYYATLKDKLKGELSNETLLHLVGGSAFNLDQKIEKGRQVELQLEIRNLSQGAWPELLEKPPQELLDVALRAHHSLGLSYSGVDIKIRTTSEEFCIIEINGNPGFTFLERFYPEQVDRIQRKIVARMMKVLD